MRKAFAKLVILIILSGIISTVLFAEEKESSIFMDFRNQKISDIIYSIAEICGEGVLIDETVTGSATFRFEDRDFESALLRFASHCQLYVDKTDGVYSVSKVSLSKKENGKYFLNTENVQIEPFLNMLSRFTNRTILYDTLPNAQVTIRLQKATLEDILNLTLVKLPGFGLERIADGFYLTKNSGSMNKRNVDVFTMSKAGELFSCNIQKAGFVSVIETLFKKGEKEFVLLSKPNITLENLVYTDKDFESLLSLVLVQSNFDFSCSEGIYYLYEIQKKDAVKKFKETRIVQIKNIGIDQLLSLMPNELNASGFIKADKNNNSVILTGSSSEIQPVIDFIEKVDVPLSGRSYKDFYLENLSVKDALSVIPKNILLSDIIVLPSGNGFVTLVTEESEKRLSEYISIIDNKKESRSVKLKYIKSEELLKNLPPSVSRECITETNDASIIFFTGTEKQFTDFSNDLEKIDCPKQQIKYQLLVIQRQKTEGTNWGSSFSAGTNSGDAGYSWSGMLSNLFNINFDIISEFGVQFAGNLNAELQDGKSRVLADTTLNGISGESLSFSNTNTYRYRDIIVDTKGDLYTSTTREIISGLTLSINGWVSGDGMVTVKLDAQVSKQGSASSSSGTADTTVPPSTSEKKVSTNVRTKSGEPVVIGGLIQQEEDISEKRKPFLGRIPLIGKLFSNEQISTVESEFIIYLIPFVEKTEEALSEEENLERLIKKYAEAFE